MIRRTTLFSLVGLALLFVTAGAAQAFEGHGDRHQGFRHADRGSRFEVAVVSRFFHARVRPGFVVGHNERFYPRYERRRPYTAGYARPHYWRHRRRAFYRAQRRVRCFDSRRALRHFVYHHPAYRFHEVQRTHRGWILAPS